MPWAIQLANKATLKIRSCVEHVFVRKIAVAMDISKDIPKH